MAQSVDEVRRKAGLRGELEDVKLPPGYYKAFVELHIEQGPMLEREQIPLGIVTKIAAPASARITIEGAGGHAGGVLMPDRRDALCAASELILAIETAARTSGSIDTRRDRGNLRCVSGRGQQHSQPRAPQPGCARHGPRAARRRNGRDRARLPGNFRKATRFDSNRNAERGCARAIALRPWCEALARACEKHRLSFRQMISRAYHDSLFISRIAPAAMLFIPCRNGYSHRPDEYASPEDIARGTLVLAETLASLSA